MKKLFPPDSLTTIYRKEKNLMFMVTFVTLPCYSRVLLSQTRAILNKSVVPFSIYNPPNWNLSRYLVQAYSQISSHLKPFFRSLEHFAVVESDLFKCFSEIEHSFRFRSFTSMAPVCLEFQKKYLSSHQIGSRVRNQNENWM